MADEDGAAGLPREWGRWAALTLLEGYPLRDVLAVLRENNMPEEESVRFCARLYDDPVFEAAQALASQLQKVNSVLAMREKMRDLSGVPMAVDRRSGLGGQEFLERYYSQNTPVVLTDVCDRWPARELWTPRYLAERLSGVEVEVMSNRDADPDYEINSDQHRFVMPFDEYVKKVEATESSNDIYLVANNKVLSTPAASGLWDDFELDPRFLAAEPAHEQSFLWFGPAGTITPLHHDTINVLFNQLRGRKHFILIPSLAIHHVYNHVGVFSRVDPLNPDLERFPRFAGTPQIHLDIEPGESLFIPAGWWHHVASLDLSVSVSFTNFAFDNHVEWVHPKLPG